MMEMINKLKNGEVTIEQFEAWFKLQTASKKLGIMLQLIANSGADRKPLNY